MWWVGNTYLHRGHSAQRPNLGYPQIRVRVYDSLSHGFARERENPASPEIPHVRHGLDLSRGTHVRVLRH
jgi:hypothetical protein